MRALALLLAVACTTGTATSDDTGDTGADALPLDPDVASYVPADLAPADPVRVIFMGDSITAGFGAPGGLSYPELLEDNDRRRWPEFETDDLATTHPGITDFVDVSVSGATTTTLLDGQLPALKTRLGASVSGETLVVITIGGNDVVRALSPTVDPKTVIDRMLRNIEDIVDDLQGDDRFADGPPAIYITNVYEPSDGTGQVQATSTHEGCFFGFDFGDALPELARYNEAFEELARDKGFAAVDMRGHFLGHGFFSKDDDLDVHHPDDPTKWFDADCIHPNSRGHHEIRRLFHAAILDEPLRLKIPTR